MMYESIREIQKTFLEKDLKCRVEQMGENWVLKAGVKGKNCLYEFLFIKSDDIGNDVAVRVFDFVKFPKEQMAAACETLNDLQITYRFVRFSLREDGNVIVEYDFPAEYAPIGEGAAEIMIRLTQILDQCYPVLMKAIWN